MPIEIISGLKAWDTYSENKNSEWPRRTNPDRIYPITSVGVKRSFTLSKNDTFFCIGNCFTRAIERSLHSMDYNVLSIVDTLSYNPKKVRYQRIEAVFKKSILNKYNLPTILNELELALTPELKFEEKYFYKTIDNLYQDYQLVGPNYTDDIDTLLNIRHAVNSTYEKIKEATVVVILLGLSEAWFDKENEVYLNHAPTKSLIHSNPNRFELHVLNANESYTYLEKIYKLLNKYMKNDFKLMITLSPVPLSATFRDQDAFTANSYSQAVLRSAVEEFMIDKKNVDYFPSFEIVTLSYPQLVWDDKDFRHIDSYFVDYMVSSILMQYMDDGMNKDEKYIKLMLSKAKILYRSGYMEEAKDILEKLPNNMLNAQELMIQKTIQITSNEKIVNKIIKILSLYKKYSFREVFQDIKYRLTKTKSNYDMQGFVDKWDGKTLSGWVINAKLDIATVKVIIEGEKEPITVMASGHREDVRKAKGINKVCAYSIPLKIEKSKKLLIHVVEQETGKELDNSPFYSDKYFP